MGELGPHWQPPRTQHEQDSCSLSRVVVFQAQGHPDDVLVHKSTWPAMKRPERTVTVIQFRFRLYRSHSVGAKIPLLDKLLLVAFNKMGVLWAVRRVRSGDPSHGICSIVCFSINRLQSESLTAKMGGRGEWGFHLHKWITIEIIFPLKCLFSRTRWRAPIP